MTYPPQPPGGDYQGGNPYPYQQPARGSVPPGAVPLGAGAPGQFGNFGGPTPPQKKSPVPWITGGSLVPVALLVLLGGGFGWPGWFNGTNNSNPKSVAEELATATNNRDQGGAEQISCDHSGGLSKSDLDNWNKVHLHAQLYGDPQVTGDSAIASYNVSAHRSIEGRTYNKDNWKWTAKLQKKGGSWCLNSFAPADLHSGGAAGSSGLGSSGSGQAGSGDSGRSHSSGSASSGSGSSGASSAARSSGSGQSTGGGQNSNGDADQLLQRLAGTISSGDLPGTDSLLCRDISPSSKQRIDQLAQQHAQAQVAGTAEVTGEAGGAALEVTVDGQQKLYSVALTHIKGPWCVTDVFGG